MNPIQKQLDKNKNQFPKQRFKNVDNKKLPQSEEKTLPQDRKEKYLHRHSS